MDLQLRIKNGNMKQISAESGIETGVLIRISSGKGRTASKRSLAALNEYFMKVDAGYRFK